MSTPLSGSYTQVLPLTKSKLPYDSYQDVFFTLIYLYMIICFYTTSERVSAGLYDLIYYIRSYIIYYMIHDILLGLLNYKIHRIIKYSEKIPDPEMILPFKSPYKYPYTASKSTNKKYFGEPVHFSRGFF